jgi:integrase
VVISRRCDYWPAKCKARARLGQDIIAEKQAAAAQNANTLSSLVGPYLDAREGELRENSLREVTRYLRVTWKLLHKLPVASITRQDIIGIIDGLSHKVAADRARMALSGLYGWAICDTNPTMHVASRAKNGSRTRTLSEAELATVWQACLDDDYGRIVRLLILTGQRRAEISDLAWTEIDLEKRQIELREQRTKNGRPHIIPLSAEALALLPPQREDRDYMFGRGAGAFSGFSKCKEELDARIAAARKTVGLKPMPAWRLHDVRRSVVTLLGELGFAQPHVIEMLVNHISGHKAGVAGTYNRALYLEERRQAIEAWGRHVLSVVARGKGREKRAKPRTRELV